jgi:hypothetical protein
MEDISMTRTEVTLDRAHPEAERRTTAVSNTCGRLATLEQQHRQLRTGDRGGHPAATG